MKMTYQEFIDTVKVLRMLYGVKIATHFFEVNMEEFTGVSPNRLHEMLQLDNINSTRETQPSEV